VTPRRCLTANGSVVHVTLDARYIWPTKAWEGHTICRRWGIAFILTDVPEANGGVIVGNNTDPVTCTRCIAALIRLGDAIDACIAGRSG